MKLTAQQQQMMARCGIACSQAGADIQTARASVQTVIEQVSTLIGTLEDPGERISWSTVRQTWLELEVKLEQCVSKFEQG